MTPPDDDIPESDPTEFPSVNAVHLVGRLSQPLQEKRMPSGDRYGRWNLVVKRPDRTDPDSDDRAGHAEATGAPRRRQSHDTIGCVTFDELLLDRLSDLAPGARLEVHGALRRRFFPGQDGRQSSYNVEAFTVAVLFSPPAEMASADEPAAADRTAAAAESVTAAG